MRILITGSSSGLGRAIATDLLARGHEVWGWARSDQSGFAVGHGSRFRHASVDVSAWDAVQTAAGVVAAEWNSLDALICAAGTLGEVAPALAADPQRWSETVAANLDGTYHPVRALHALVQAAPRRGKILCFSGGGATQARPNFSAYGVAKTAVVRLVETIAAENPDAGFDINAVAPGAIATPMLDEVIALGPERAGSADYAAALRAKAAGQAPADRALALVRWLLSPESDGITGRLLSAPWDPWSTLGNHVAAVAESDCFTLRRITPADRDRDWGAPPA
ncbi:MAG: SDR family oxidoreductase [Verrucomicrobia bacterium]|nr:SDR family oxidoreductase [Verrucomicrobiota bacterium]